MEKKSQSYSDISLNMASWDGQDLFYMSMENHRIFSGNFAGSLQLRVIDKNGIVNKVTVL